MDILIRQVRRAQRRLNFQVFLHTLSGCWAVCLVFAAVLVALDKYVSLGLLWWAWPALALAVGTVAAVAITWWRRRRTLDAAVEIDRRFGLKERVSSCLALSDADRETPCGRALIADAMARVERVDVDDRFAVRLNRWSAMPLLPAAAAVLLGLLLQPSLGRQAGASTVAQATRQQIKRSTEKLNKQIEAQRKQAEAAGLKEIEELLTQVERGTEQLLAAQPDERKEALVKLNDLAENLRKRRDELGSAEELKKQLEQLKNLNQGPADRMANALRNGDFKQALEELRDLEKKLRDGNLKEEEKAQLQQQVEQLAEKLQKMADAGQQRQRQLEQEIERQRAAGNTEQANKLEQELQKLKQAEGQRQRMAQMAAKLGQCAKCLGKGDGPGASQQLSELESELSELARNTDELEMLETALDQLDAAKDSMGCKKCQGRGCAKCQGGKGQGQGEGLGEGQGRGDRPEERTDTKSYDSQVKQKVGRGASVLSELVEGPNAKGQVLQEIQSEFNEAAASETDPSVDQPLPRDVRDHARDYFEGLREGQR
ncbi:MAG: hypothetical protein K1X74_02430 [Pirellulales bacterium]|nr:hypothetical protein [Pirellulales bacterium]